MKKVTCSAMGGPCEEEITGKSADEVATAGYQHMKETDDAAHKAMKAQIDAATEEEKKKWFKKFEKTFADAPDA